MTRIESKRRSRGSSCLFIVVALAALTTEARATATFSADATVSLTVVSIFNEDSAAFETSVPVGLGILGAGDVFAADNTTGVATASATASATPLATPAAIGIGGVVSQTATVFGSADVAGAADAIAESFGTLGPLVSLLVENTTGVEYNIEILLDYALSATASVDNAATEDAQSEVSFDLVSLEGSFDLFELVEADALGLGSPAPIADMQRFSVTLAAGDSEGWDLFISASGFASASAIPAPGSLFLIMLGLPLLLVRAS